MTINRDVVLWIIILGAIATYGSMMPSPMTWTWQQWCQTVAAVAGIVAAKLSPAPGEK